MLSSPTWATFSRQWQLSHQLFCCRWVFPALSHGAADVAWTVGDTCHTRAVCEMRRWFCVAGVCWLFDRQSCWTVATWPAVNSTSSILSASWCSNSHHSTGQMPHPFVICNGACLYNHQFYVSEQLVKVWMAKMILCSQLYFKLIINLLTYLSATSGSCNYKLGQDKRHFLIFKDKIMLWCSLRKTTFIIGLLYFYNGFSVGWDRDPCSTYEHY